MTRERSFRFGPLERRGLVGALSLSQCLLLALAGVSAIATLNAAPNPSGALIALLLAGAGAAVAFVPLGQRSISQWLLPVVTYLGRRLRLRRELAELATDGVRLPATVDSVRTVGDRRKPARPAPPAPLRGVRILAAPYRDGEIGVLREPGGRRLTAVLACRVTAFSLLDAEARERRLARWGLLLAGAAGSPITRLQWIERTAPAQGDELVRWLHEERDPALPARGTAMIESYLELIGSATRVAQEHEILLAIQIDVRRVRDRARGGTTTALVEHVERTAQSLGEGEVRVLGALTPGHLSRCLRTAFDPYLREQLAALETADRSRDGLAEAHAWPLASEERWDHYRADGALHATYWIAGWPRVEVSGMFMEALLGRASAVRSVSVTFEPVAPERSTREAEAAITRDRADRDLRRRFGQSETARQRQSAEAATRREAELAAGHGEVRLAGFITVSGRDADELRRACAEVHEQAARARLELHRLYGQQAAGFTFTLPLCRGLR